MQNQPEIWRPALISGAIFGVLSGVPILGALNCLCCSLLLGAGMVSSWMLVRESAGPLGYGRAALAGLVSGAFAAPVCTLTMALFLVIRGGSVLDQIEQGIERGREMSLDVEEASQILTAIPASVFFALMMVVLVILFAPFGALGGVIGRAIFERRTPSPQAGADGGQVPPDTALPPT